MRGVCGEYFPVEKLLTDLCLTRWTSRFNPHVFLRRKVSEKLAAEIQSWENESP